MLIIDPLPGNIVCSALSDLRENEASAATCSASASKHSDLQGSGIRGSVVSLSVLSRGRKRQLEANDPSITSELLKRTLWRAEADPPSEVAAVEASTSKCSAEQPPEPESPLSSESSRWKFSKSSSGVSASILHDNMDQTRVVATPLSNIHFENCPSKSRTQQPHCIWEGSVKHMLSSGKTIELFGLVLPVPIDLIESFPPTLFVSELLPVASAVRSPNDCEAHCCFRGVSDDHCRIILKLVETKLCITLRLQDCMLWLSPARLNNGKFGARCVFRRTA